MADEVHDWVEKLLAELKRVSTKKWAGGKEAFSAIPTTIERAIRQRSAGIDSKLLRSYYDQARSDFDELVHKSDPYSQTLIRAFSLLSR